MRRLTSGRARRRYLRWQRYQDRIDALVEHQDLTRSCLHPIRATPGFFRAEGWSTDRGDLRHGA